MVISRRRTFVLSAVLGSIQRIAQIVGMLIVTPLVLDALGQDQFGVWGAATSLIWMTGVADLGIGFPLITHVAKSRSAGDEWAAGGFVTIAASITLIPLVLGLVGAGAILASGYSHGVLYAIAIGALALNAPLGIANRVWIGLQKTYVANTWDLLQAFLFFCLIGAAALSHAGLVALVAAAYVAMLLSNLGSSLRLYIQHPQLRPRNFAAARTVARTMLREAGMYLALVTAGLLAIWCDNLIALHLLGERASAVMSIVLRIGLGGMAVLDALATPLWPAFAEAVALQDRSRIRRLLVTGTAVIGGAGICGAAIVGLFGAHLLAIWLGGRLTVPPDVLWALAAWLVAQALGKAASVYFNASSDMTFQVRLALFYGMAALGAKLLMVGPMQVAGILWGTTIVYGAVVLPACCIRLVKTGRV